MNKGNKLKVKSQKSKVKTHYLILFLLPFFSFSTFYCKAQSLVPLSANAGSNTGICPNDSVMIGGNPAATGGTPPYIYSWQPTAGLNNPTSQNPNAAPSSPTNYTLTVTDGVSNSSVDIVFVDTFPLPNVYAGPNQTILQGMNTILQGSGAVNYYWTPTQSLYNQNTANPISEPVSTTNYQVLGVDANGCVNYDNVIIYVIPSDTLIVYNAFTPNADGFNDFLYITNIEKFPESKLEVYNRNGKLILKRSSYLNDWDGKIDGTELPCATYYYILSPGSDKAKMHGSITIIR